MSYFVITYDLVRKRDYERIETGIQNTKASIVRNFLNEYIDLGDKLFVVGLGESVKPWAVTRVDKCASNWLLSLSQNSF